MFLYYLFNHWLFLLFLHYLFGFPISWRLNLLACYCHDYIFCNSLYIYLTFLLLCGRCCPLYHKSSTKCFVFIIFLIDTTSFSLFIFFLEYNMLFKEYNIINYIYRFLYFSLSICIAFISSKFPFPCFEWSFFRSRFSPRSGYLHPPSNVKKKGNNNNKPTKNRLEVLCGEHQFKVIRLLFH